MSVGYYQSIESFALVDGPGVRSVIFLQGCPFRCMYCHNPDTWPFNKTNPITPTEALNKLYRYKTYWKDNGGITISGGEPLAQIDFLLEFCKLCKEQGIHITIDTSGATFTRNEPYFSKFQELLKYVDLIMLDIKALNSDLHQKITGSDNKHVLDMFDYLASINFPIWIRHVLVPTLTDNDDSLKEIGAFIATLPNVKRVEVLPYHTLGLFKYEKLNIKYPLADVNPPSEERIKNANELLRTASYTGYLQK